MNKVNIDRILSEIASSKKEILKRLVEVASIPSPSGLEIKKIKYLRNKLALFGLKKLVIDPVGNCLGEYVAGKNSSHAKNILIVAHSDTACNPGEKVEIKEDKKYIYGHGICDNSAGIIGILTTLNIIKKHKLKFPHNLIFGFTVREEGLGAKRGMKEIIKKNKNRIDAVINIESHNIGRIVYKANGQYRSKITIDTKFSGHSYRDFGRPNANVILANIISDFSKYKLPKQTTYNVADFEGLGAVNTIAKDASCLFEIRSENNTNFKKTIKELEKLIKKYQRLHKGVVINRDILACESVVEFPKVHKLYQLTKKAMEKLGIKYFFSQANTDGDVSLAAGIPTVTLGSSLGWNTHSLDEYVDKESFVLGMQQVVLIIYLIASQY